MVIVREERQQDIQAIRVVNEQAFERTAEADLIDFLRSRRKLSLSLVATDGDSVVGHIAFSPVGIVPLPGAELDRVACDHDPRATVPGLSGVGLGPMAVLPELQRQGIGTSLIREGLARLVRLDLEYAVVLGHPPYYPRFGFLPASRFGLRCAWPAPDEAFMALELKPGALEGVAGTVFFLPEFDGV